MLFTRFTLLASVALFAGGFFAAPVLASQKTVVAEPFYAGIGDKKADDEVPRPRPTPGPRERVANFIVLNPESIEQKKGETPPRPRPKPGPKDGGEDE